jgi:hypothetical protein
VEDDPVTQLPEIQNQPQSIKDFVWQSNNVGYFPGLPAVPGTHPFIVSLNP